MKTLHTLLITVFFLLLNLASQAQDIQSSTRGFSAELNYGFGAWESDSAFFGDVADAEPNGYGFGVKLGYGLNQNIEVFVSYNSASYAQEFAWNNYRHQRSTLGAAYYFGATLRKFRPFVKAGISFNELAVDPVTFDGFLFSELKMNGVGVLAGGGVHYFFKPNMSLSASAAFNFGSYASSKFSGEKLTFFGEKPDFTITTIDIGLSYYFE